MLHARPKLGSPGRRKRRLSALSRAACATCGATHLSGAFAERVALARARARGWRSPSVPSHCMHIYQRPGAAARPRQAAAVARGDAAATARAARNTLWGQPTPPMASLWGPRPERGGAGRPPVGGSGRPARRHGALRVARDSCPIWQRVAAGAAAAAHAQGREAARGHVSDIAQRHAGANARAAPRTRGWGWGERPPSCNDSRNDPTTSFFCW